MKKFWFILLITVIIPFLLFSQRENIKLNFKAFDYSGNTPLIIDSIIVVNIDKNCDTVLYEPYELYLNCIEGISRNIMVNDFKVGMKRSNPFKGYTVIFADLKKQGDIYMELYNANGRKLTEKQFDLTSGTHSFNVYTRDPGLYFIVIKQGKLIRVLKLVNSEYGRSYGITYCRQSGKTTTFKSTMNNNVFEFCLGDSLSYTAFSYGYEPLTIIDAPLCGDTVYHFYMKPNLIDFSADCTIGYVPLNVQFSGITNMNVNSWFWDFGDGITSVEQNPNHIYDNEGIYTVSLTATNEYGSYTKTKTDYITVNSDTGTFVDPRDGQTYKFVVIGSQVWFAENLRYLPSVSPSSDGSQINPRYYVYDYQGYNVSEAKTTYNYLNYGVLYNAAAAANACPEGWHVPTDYEWKILEIYIGMSETEVELSGWRGSGKGKKLKSTNYWYDGGNGTDSYGFKALPGGYRDFDKTFRNITKSGIWWSISSYNAESKWARFLVCNLSGICRCDYKNEIGLSVRCIRNWSNKQK